MQTRGRRRGAITVTAVLVGIAALGALAVATLRATRPMTPDQLAARETLLDLLKTTRMSSYHPDIDGFVRAATGAPSSAVLVASTPAVEGGDVIGTLTFAVTLPELADPPLFSFDQREVDPGPHCFRVTFTPYGKAGEWGTPEGVRPTGCPDDTTPMTPPPSDDPVVAVDARDAAWQVLEDLDPTGTPDPDDVARQVTARLTPPSDGRPLAQVTAVVDGTDVGVATGGPDDCVLVARVDGTVADVHVAPVQLQPGEAGCTAWTALAGLDPPH